MSEEKKKRGLAILGSTGSIGTQALEVLDEQSEHFDLQVLTANSNGDLLIKQALKYRPNHVVIGDESQFKKLQDILFDEGIKVYAGAEALSQVVAMESVDIVLTALVGYAGLIPTLAAIDAGKDIALSNKETLVVAGELVMAKAAEKGVAILPVDSEHSALFQCIVGEAFNPIEKIYLTASGGPFRGKSTAELGNIKPEQALKHPNWDMGAKITIDSATLMNKGLEVIEAKWLFNLKPEQIDVIVHPQSVIHSIVQFEDGSMKAQMGIPDMKLPIQYALGFPRRMKNSFPRFNFLDYPNLTFEQADRATFMNLDLAFEALNAGGNTACVLNAANEINVEAFLNKKIGFLDIAKLNQRAMKSVDFVKKPGLSDYIETDSLARKLASSYI